MSRAQPFPNHANFAPLASKRHGKMPRKNSASVCWSRARVAFGKESEDLHRAKVGFADRSKRALIPRLAFSGKRFLALRRAAWSARDAILVHRVMPRSRELQRPQGGMRFAASHWFSSSILPGTSVICRTDATPVGVGTTRRPIPRVRR